MTRIFSLFLVLSLIINSTVLSAASYSLSDQSTVEISSTNFPDSIFMEKVKEYDLDSDNFLSDEEISKVTYMYLNYMQIKDLRGIEYFTNLLTLHADMNYLKTLDLSKNTKLKYLYCNNNMLTDIKLPVSLERLELFANEFTQLDLSNLKNLKFLYVNDNYLTHLDLSNNPLNEGVGFVANYNFLESITLPDNNMSYEFSTNLYEQLYPKENITRIYNILDEVQETKPILKLISATRVSKEKGYERMLKFAQELKKANIRFRWIIFTDLNLYNQKPFDLEEIVYMKPSHDFFDYIKEADYGVQLSDTEGYSYFINECLQYGTPVICTNFPSAYESVENEKNGYILDMNLSNLDINKIINNIPKNFLYKEKCSEKDWIALINKKVERKNKNMYKVIAKQDYTDKRPELIENYCDGKKIEFNDEGNAKIKKNDIYYVNDNIRAMQIKESGLAEVEEEIETATKKVDAETAIKKTRKVKKIEVDLDKGTVKEE